MSDYRPPLRFSAHYVGECGEEFEMFNMALPELRLPCEECEKTHKFRLVKVEYGV